MVGTLGTVATGVDPVRYLACHSQHVTRCLPREGETFTCLHLKQEVTLKHLASQDCRQPYQTTVNKMALYPLHKYRSMTFTSAAKRSRQPNSTAFSGVVCKSLLYELTNKKTNQLNMTGVASNPSSYIKIAATSMEPKSSSAQNYKQNSEVTPPPESVNSVKHKFI
jgi:hypothetical protein